MKLGRLLEMISQLDSKFLDQSLAETYLAIVESIEAENASSGRSDFIRYPRNPPYDPPPVVRTRNFEEFKDALKTHGTYMEINVPVDVHPYIRQRVFL